MIEDNSELDASEKHAVDFTNKLDKVFHDKLAEMAADGENFGRYVVVCGISSMIAKVISITEDKTFLAEVVRATNIQLDTITKTEKQVH